MTKFGVNETTARDLATSTLLDVFGVLTNVRDREQEAQQRRPKTAKTPGADNAGLYNRQRMQELIFCFSIVLPHPRRSGEFEDMDATTRPEIERFRR